LLNISIEGSCYLGDFERKMDCYIHTMAIAFGYAVVYREIYLDSIVLNYCFDFVGVVNEIANSTIDSILLRAFAYR
jgi:hypothetical protein